MSSIHQVYSFACLMVTLTLTRTYTHSSSPHVYAYAHPDTHTHNRRQAARNENIVVPVHRRSKSLSVCVYFCVSICCWLLFPVCALLLQLFTKLGAQSVRHTVWLSATLHTFCNIRQLKFLQHKIESVLFESENWCLFVLLLINVKYANLSPKMSK